MRDPSELAVPPQVIAGLRQPLSSMLQAVELLAMAPLDATTCQPHLQALRSHGQKLAAMLSDLEQLDRLHQRPPASQLDTFRPAALLQQLLASQAATAAEHHLELRLDANDQLPAWLHGDGPLLERMGQRVLAAMLERTLLGPIDLAARYADGSLELLFQARCCQANPADMLADLGLAFVAQMATSLAGDLAVQLHGSGGLSLLLRLPFALPAPWEEELAAAADAPAAPDTPPRRLAGKVLVIDGQRDQRLQLERLLAHAGLLVETAADGQVAAHLLRAQHYDLVLLDLQLPGFDALAATRSLRATGLQTPIVALTTTGGHRAREQCLAAGCNEQLTKPVAPPVLAQTLALYLAAAGERDSNSPPRPATE